MQIKGNTGDNFSSLSLLLASLRVPDTGNCGLTNPFTGAPPLLFFSQAIFDVLPKITAILVLFALIMYIFAVMCTELFGEIDYTGRFSEDGLDHYDYFSRLDYSLFTLFQMVTLDWAKVTRATMQVYPWAWSIFSTFVTFSSYVLYNLIIAVVCDAVKMVQDQQDILMVENYVKDKIESRHRIINLRQKLDKMSKQQMDLLLYIQLILEQLDDVDEASKQHYEETLLHLGQTSENAREALLAATRGLDHIDFDSIEKELPHQREMEKQPPPPPSKGSSPQSPTPEPESPPKSEPRQRRVSFKVGMSSPSQQYSRNNSIDLSNEDDGKTTAKQKNGRAANEPATDQDSVGQNYFGAIETLLRDQGDRSASTIDESFHSCVTHDEATDEP